MMVQRCIVQFGEDVVKISTFVTQEALCCVIPLRNVLNNAVKTYCNIMCTYVTDGNYGLSLVLLCNHC